MYHFPSCLYFFTYSWFSPNGNISRYFVEALVMKQRKLMELFVSSYPCDDGGRPVWHQQQEEEQQKERLHDDDVSQCLLQAHKLKPTRLCHMCIRDRLKRKVTRSTFIKPARHSESLWLTHISVAFQKKKKIQATPMTTLMSLELALTQRKHSDTSTLDTHVIFSPSFLPFHIPRPKLPFSILSPLLQPHSQWEDVHLETHSPTRFEWILVTLF